MAKVKKLSGKSLQKVASKIKAVIFDIDGVMTDGRIFFVEGTGWGAMYSVIDGFGIRRLQRAGIEVGVISGGAFTSHKKRAESLHIKHAYFGNEDKIESFEKICREVGVSASEVAYIGDELFDIPVLERVGLAATPPHAPQEVKDKVHYVTKKPGGFGAVREFADIILNAHAGAKPLPKPEKKKGK